MVKLSSMGWGDHPELCRCPSAVTRGLKMHYMKRLVIFVTSVTIPPERIGLPMWCCLIAWGWMETGRCRDIPVSFMLCVYVCLYVCTCVCS